jgi:DNA-directed RNA polymerase subunit L
MSSRIDHLETQIRELQVEVQALEHTLVQAVRSNLMLTENLLAATLDVKGDEHLLEEQQRLRAQTHSFIAQLRSVLPEFGPEAA